eukprot:TRINITY_DN13246_c0_g1_i1.p1 TRINITY_DN13246_c0_g1~~TRINITY_DN13246_c0_g1_i1.p1  ORF type:complete len:311 (-),score=35.70 TRINITY_DN13246_c0_g1_i1:77-1009(-)
MILFGPMKNVKAFVMCLGTKFRKVVLAATKGEQKTEGLMVAPQHLSVPLTPPGGSYCCLDHPAPGGSIQANPKMEKKPCPELRGWGSYSKSPIIMLKENYKESKDDWREMEIIASWASQEDCTALNSNPMSLTALHRMALVNLDIEGERKVVREKSAVDGVSLVWGGNEEALLFFKYAPEEANMDGYCCVNTDEKKFVKTPEDELKKYGSSFCETTREQAVPLLVGRDNTGKLLPDGLIWVNEKTCENYGKDDTKNAMGLYLPMYTLKEDGNIPTMVPAMIIEESVTVREGVAEIDKDLKKMHSNNPELQ